ncbi:Detected protein of unknown function [Hibiscus syriacus]|uniref:DUF4704 domain-containing protein n=1 Tax=Hibiscus syriacus TaxID=106335 RepID=A0A6A2YE00_HIBSY|nr:Detected protein of unknown function [Hibiscus syriacus]
MEEEDKKKFGETSVRSDKIGGSHQENVNYTIGEEDVFRNDNVVSQGFHSAPMIGDHDKRDPVFLENQAIAAGESHCEQTDSNQFADLDYDRCSSDQFDEYSQHLTIIYGMDHDSLPTPFHDRSNSSPGPARQTDFSIKQSSSATCLDYVFYADSGCSPNDSPRKPKPKAAMPNVSPELLHLVDSAIMGKPESLNKLKNIVAGAETFGIEEDIDSIPFLVVDSLIATMGGVESFEEDDDSNPPSVMLNSRAAIVAGELIPWLPWQGDSDIFMSSRTRMVITRTLTTIWAPRLMLALEKAVSGRESRGPACTFEFDGESSGLLGPGESRWPFTNGFAFATWIYIECFADTLNTATAAAAAKSGKSSAMSSSAAAASELAGQGTAHMPCLFSFLSADNKGIEAYFHAQFLVVESGSVKGKKVSLHFTHVFKPQCWYFIGLEHACRQGLIGKADSELRLYIDGSLYESYPYELPRISRPLAFSCIGTSPPPSMAGLQHRRRQCPLFAEMGPIYIFKEPIGPERMARIASRGGDKLPSFGNGAGVPWLATNDNVQRMAWESCLLDAEIGDCLHLLYHPCLLTGRFCADASPSGAAVQECRMPLLLRVICADLLRLWTSPCCNTDETCGGSLGFSLWRSHVLTSSELFLLLRHPGNSEELRRARGLEILSRILNYLLQTLSSLGDGMHNGVSNEQLVAAVVSLYMVFTESSVMRDANAMQMLDGCRRSSTTFMAEEVVRCYLDSWLIAHNLIRNDPFYFFQIARVLHLIYRSETEGQDETSTKERDKISLKNFESHTLMVKAFQAAPNSYDKHSYTALLGPHFPLKSYWSTIVSISNFLILQINAYSTEDRLNFYDAGHRFEHLQLLAVLLRSLPYASRAFQSRAVQDLLFLACSHPENRISLTKMEEWPEWTLEVLIYNYEDIEATIHCAEWLSIVGGSNTRDQRIRYYHY